MSLYFAGKVNDEWLTGEINGKSGIFPSNYIKEITESTGESMTSATSGNHEALCNARLRTILSMYC